jgi:hypothetical protein
VLRCHAKLWLRQRYDSVQLQLIHGYDSVYSAHRLGPPPCPAALAQRTLQRRPPPWCMLLSAGCMLVQATVSYGYMSDAWDVDMLVVTGSIITGWLSDSYISDDSLSVMTASQ